MQENSPLSGHPSPRHTGLWIFILFALLGSIACVCTGSGGEEAGMCTATYTLDGQSFTGRDEDDITQAELNACNLYCVENDPDFLAMYQIYLDANGLNSSDLSPQDAIFEDDELLDQVTLVCAPQCIVDAAVGIGTLESSCSE